MFIYVSSVVGSGGGFVLGVFDPWRWESGNEIGNLDIIGRVIKFRFYSVLGVC